MLCYVSYRSRAAIFNETRISRRRVRGGYLHISFQLFTRKTLFCRTNSDKLCVFDLFLKRCVPNMWQTVSHGGSKAPFCNFREEPRMSVQMRLRTMPVLIGVVKGLIFGGCECHFTSENVWKAMHPMEWTWNRYPQKMNCTMGSSFPLGPKSTFSAKLPIH